MRRPSSTKSARRAAYSYIPPPYNTKEKPPSNLVASTYYSLDHIAAPTFCEAPNRIVNSASCPPSFDDSSSSATTLLPPPEQDREDRSPRAAQSLPFASNALHLDVILLPPAQHEAQPPAMTTPSMLPREGTSEGVITSPNITTCMERSWGNDRPGCPLALRDVIELIFTIVGVVAVILTLGVIFGVFRK